MFVMNLTDTELEYSTNGNRIKLFPGTVTEIEDSIVSAEKLKGCYGNMIDIIGEDRVAKVKEELKVELPVEHAEVLDSLFGNANKLAETLTNLSETDTEKAPQDEESVPSEEYLAKVKIADTYFTDIEQDNDSDKHLKLEIARALQEEATKEGKTYDNVSLMEEIERIFTERKADITHISEVEEFIPSGPVDTSAADKDLAEIVEQLKGETSNENKEENNEGAPEEVKEDVTKTTDSIGKVDSTTKKTVKAPAKNKTKGNKKK